MIKVLYLFTKTKNVWAVWLKGTLSTVHSYSDVTSIDLKRASFQISMIKIAA